MDQPLNDVALRGSPELWLDAAYEALIEGGVDAVKILPLANRLKLARTSFYWFFKDREELLTTLADRWANKNTGALLAATQAYAESEAEAMLNVIGCFLDPAAFDTRFEFAVRSWALQSPEIMARLNATDRERIAALAVMLERWGHEPVDADVRARTVYLTQIGYISMQVRETLEERMRRVPSYVEIFTGQGPEPRELARFHARFGYAPDEGGGRVMRLGTIGATGWLGSAIGRAVLDSGGSFRHQVLFSSIAAAPNPTITSGQT